MTSSCTHFFNFVAAAFYPVLKLHLQCTVCVMAGLGIQPYFARSWQDFTSSFVIVITVLQLFGAFNRALSNNTIYSLYNLVRQTLNRTVSQKIKKIISEILIHQTRLSVLKRLGWIYFVN